MAYDVREVLDIKATLGEGPVWSPEERVLYFVDILKPALYRYDPFAKDLTEYPMPEHAAGFGLRRKGGFIIGMRTGIYLFDRHGNREVKVADNPTDPDKSRFNDGMVDPWGRFWCGTIWEAGQERNAKICMVNVNLEMKVMFEDLNIANGIAFTPDRRWVYYTDTSNHLLYRNALNPDNGDVTGEREIVRRFRKEDGQPPLQGQPDGASFDAKGGYWSAQYGDGLVFKLTADGDVADRIELPVPRVTMAAFGGNDLQTLYITTATENMTPEEIQKYPASGNLYSVRVEVPGLKVPYFIEK